MLRYFAVVTILSIIEGQCKLTYPRIGQDTPVCNKAFLVSLDNARFARTSALLVSVGFNVTRVWPIALSDPSLLLLADLLTANDDLKAARTASIGLTNAKAWVSAALDPSHAIPDDCYFTVFEDDVSLDEHVSPGNVQLATHTAASMSHHAGYFYLGMGCA